mmetsp:Transcript_23952/g.68812  ORF Transcript_23952/g.68812 Transcript_23952/m.68812 type:complete len:272 (-) Transcript_23952:152-967(-)
MTFLAAAAARCCFVVPTAMASRAGVACRRCSGAPSASPSANPSPAAPCRLAAPCQAKRPCRPRRWFAAPHRKRRSRKRRSTRRSGRRGWRPSSRAPRTGRAALGRSCSRAMRRAAAARPRGGAESATLPLQDRRRARLRWPSAPPRRRWTQPRPPPATRPRRALSRRGPPARGWTSPPRAPFRPPPPPTAPAAPRSPPLAPSEPPPGPRPPTTLRPRAFPERHRQLLAGTACEIRHRQSRRDRREKAHETGGRQRCRAAGAAGYRQSRCSR